MKFFLRILLVLVLLIAGLFMALGYFTVYYTGPKTDHFDGTQFSNPSGSPSHGIMRLLKWKLQHPSSPWPAEPEKPLSDIPPARVEGSDLRVSFIGHATVLLQTQGLNIITDPIYANIASPFDTIGPKRFVAPGVSFEHLPKIDLVLVSHNHYDHLNRETLRDLWQRDRPLILVPLGNDTIINDAYPAIKTQALDWHQSHKLKNITVTLMPVQHWSARWTWDRNKALWGGYVIETPGGNIFFAGDTGYGGGEPFRSAHKKFGDFRLALLPIGAYEPRWFMEYSHMNPEEAVKAAGDLHTKHAMAIHFGTFKLSDEGYMTPVEVLEKLRQTNHLSDTQFRALKIGENWHIPSQ